jgi:hypothetical protein
VAYWLVGARILISIVFAVAVATKVAGPRAFSRFAASLDGFTWLPRRWRRPTAVAAIAVEASVVALVAATRTAPIGLGLAAVAAAVFTVSAATAQRRGGRVVCRCFGGGETPWGRAHAVRNGGLGFVAASGAVVGFTSAAGEPLAVAAVLTVSAFAALAALILIRLDDFSYILGFDRR